MGQVEAFLQLLDNRKQCRTFILVSLVELISDGITARCDKQPQYHLGILVLAVPDGTPLPRINNRNRRSTDTTEQDWPTLTSGQRKFIKTRYKKKYSVLSPVSILRPFQS